MPGPVTGFPPIAGPDARVLILGSMPSEESLRQQQYYAHPRNAFWPIMMTLLGLSEFPEYDQRKAILLDRGIAVWDTLKSCIREGSLDSSIVDGSVVTNDFEKFYRQHPAISSVFFNGRKSEQVYRQRVLPLLSRCHAGLRYHLLPSTSPAMASLNRQQKIDGWKVVLRALYE